MISSRYATGLFLVAAFICTYRFSHGKTAAFDFESSTSFRKILACSDVESVHRCMAKHTGQMLADAKPHYTKLAFQVIETCVMASQGVRHHDYQEFLKIQKCFHVGDLVDYASAPQAGHFAPIPAVPVFVAVAGCAAAIFTIVEKVSPEVIKDYLGGLWVLFEQHLGSHLLCAYTWAVNVTSQFALTLNQSFERLDEPRSADTESTGSSALTLFWDRDDLDVLLETPRQPQRPTSKVTEPQQEPCTKTQFTGNTKSDQVASSRTSCTATPQSLPLRSPKSTEFLNAVFSAAEKSTASSAHTPVGPPDTKPAFDISSEAGRAKLKAYVREKLGQPAPHLAHAALAPAQKDHQVNHAKPTAPQTVFTSNRAWRPPRRHTDENTLFGPNGGVRPYP